MSDAPEHGWMIHKAGRGWYRPNARGYTSSTAEAGRFSHKDAMEYSHPNGWGGPRDNITIKHESEVSDREQLPRVKLFTEDQYAAAVARAERAEAALAVAEEALRMSAELSYGEECDCEYCVAIRAARSALAKIAALKGGAA